MPPDETVPPDATVESPLEPVSPEAASLEAEIADSVGQITFRLSDKSSKPRNDLKSVEAEIAECQGDIDRLKGELEAAGQTVEEKKGQRDVAQLRLTELSGELRVLNELLHLQEVEKKAKEKAYDELAREEKDLKEGIKTTSDKHRGASDRLRELLNDPDSDECKQQTETCKKLLEDLGRLQADLTRILDQKGKASNAKLVASKDHHDAEVTAGAKASEVENAQGTHGTISGALRAAEDAFDEKIEDLKEAKKNLEGLKAREEGLREQLSKFTALGDVLNRLTNAAGAGQKELDRSSKLRAIFAETDPRIKEGAGKVLARIQLVREQLNLVELGFAGKFAVTSDRVERGQAAFSEQVALLSQLLEDLKASASNLEEEDNETSWKDMIKNLESVERLLAKHDEEDRKEHERFVQDLSLEPSTLVENGLRAIGEFDPANIVPLREQLAQATQRAEAAEGQRDTANGALAEATSALDKANARISELEALERRSIEAVAELQRALVEASDQRDAARKDVSARDGSLTATEERLRGSQADLTTAQGNLANVGVELAERTGERDGLAEEKVRLVNELKKVNDQLEAIREEMGVLRREFDEARTTVSQKTAALNVVEGRAGRAEAEVASLRGERDSATAEVERLNWELNDARGRLAGATAELEAKQALSEALVRAHENIERLTADTRELQRKLDEAKAAEDMSDDARTVEEEGFPGPKDTLVGIPPPAAVAPRRGGPLKPK